MRLWVDCNFNVLLSQGCVYGGAQMDHGDSQERAPGGQPSCGDFDRRTQTGGTQVQPAPQGL